MYPIIAEPFGFPISSFGVMVGVAFLVGGRIAGPAFVRYGMTHDDAWRIVLWAVIGGMVGSKLWYLGELLARGGAESELLSHLRGGFTWYGGLVGGTIASVTRAHLAGHSVLNVVNAAAPSLAVGQAIGRMGCFLVGDDYGRATDLPWGIAFPQGQPPTLERVHPTMLYELAWLIPVGVWLWQRLGRSPFPFGEYLVLAGVGRLAIEVLRTNPTLIGPLSNAQVTALACVAVGAVGWAYLRSRAGPVDEQATA